MLAMILGMLSSLMAFAGGGGSETSTSTKVSALESEDDSTRGAAVVATAPDPQIVTEQETTPIVVAEPAPVVVAEPAPEPEPTTPIVVAEPAPEPEPTTPVVVAEPAPEPEPVIVSEPAPEPKPTEPVFVTDPNLEPNPSEPVVVAEPAPEPEPTTPVVVAEPAPEPEPTTPVVVAEPAPEPEPTTPVVIAEPAPEPEPTTPVVVAEPAPEPEPTTPVVVAEPAPEPEPTTPVVVAEPVVVADPIDVSPSEPTLDGGDDTDTVYGGIGTDLTLDATMDASAVAGRVTTLRLDADSISEVTITSGPSFGNVTVNPDNSLAVVLTGTTEETDQSFEIEITHDDNSVTSHTINLDVTPGEQDAGWGLGNFYLLETDENGDTIVETGDHHRVVHVSGSEDALTLAEISALEGVEIDRMGDWFWRDFSYGNEDTPLAEDAAAAYWNFLTEFPSSHHVLYEKGYTYTEFDPLPNQATGESALHPLYIGAYGEGDRPILDLQVRNVQEGTDHVVVEGIEFEGGVYLGNGNNTLFEDIVATDEVFSISGMNAFTFRDSAIWDVSTDEPVNGEYWEPHPNRESGFFASQGDGLLIENSFFDHNGWAADYDPGLSTDGGQPPSLYSHNLYLQYNNLDITFRDNIVSRGASVGVQVRPGGFIEDNLLLDNNIGANFLGGQGGTDAGNYTVFTGNVTTSGQHLSADEGDGAYTWGIDNGGNLSTLHENIITHVVDPNNPDEIDAKPKIQPALLLQDGTSAPVYDDTIIYNWWSDITSKGTPDTNIDGLDTEVLDQTTIQLFTANLLGQETATIGDLADHLRAEARGEADDIVDADLIIAYFRVNFGLEVDLRSEAETLRFVPNDLGDGMRWDNRLNWTTDDLPGTQDGDRVELAGNWVEYAGAGTTRLTDFDLGSGGKLNITSGYLEVEDHLSVGENGAELTISNAGQFWTNGYTDQNLLSVSADGGRYANTGLHTGQTDMQVSGDAQVLLAVDGADYVMGTGSALSITGGDAKVGFDGDLGDTGVLLMSDEAALEFYAEDGALGSITEFRSGHFDDDGSGIQSGVNLGGATLRIDVTDLDGIGNISHDLISVDEVVGSFGDLEISGLNPNQNAVVTINYDSDVVTLQLGEIGIGTGAFVLETVGNEASAETEADLFAALTNGHGIYPDDAPEDIPPEMDDDPFTL